MYVLNPMNQLRHALSREVVRLYRNQNRIGRNKCIDHDRSEQRHISVQDSLSAYYRLLLVNEQYHRKQDRAIERTEYLQKNDCSERCRLLSLLSFLSASDQMTRVRLGIRYLFRPSSVSEGKRRSKGKYRCHHYIRCSYR